MENYNLLTGSNIVEGNELRLAKGFLRHCRRESGLKRSDINKIHGEI